MSGCLLTNDIFLLAVSSSTSGEVSSCFPKATKQTAGASEALGFRYPRCHHTSRYDCRDQSRALSTQRLSPRSYSCPGYRAPTLRQTKGEPHRVTILLATAPTPRRQSNSATHSVSVEPQPAKEKWCPRRAQPRTLSSLSILVARNRKHRRQAVRTLQRGRSESSSRLRCQPVFDTQMI